MNSAIHSADEKLLNSSADEKENIEEVYKTLDLDAPMELDHPKEEFTIIWKKKSKIPRMDHTQRKVIRKLKSRIIQVQYELEKTIEKIQKKEKHQDSSIEMLKREEKREEVREKRNIIL